MVAHYNMYSKKTHPKEYRIWKAMRARCNAPSFANSNYQKNGIKVCKEWDSFHQFILDMGECPKNFSIDRIDNLKGYCPENCRWTDNKTQTKNRGNFNLVFTYQGETLVLKDWARKYNIKYTTLYLRHKRHPELTLEEILNFKDPRKEKIEWQGKLYTRKELCNMYNIPIQNFYDRIHKGWELDKILTTPIKCKI